MKKVKNKGYKPPQWFRSLPAQQSDHGSNRDQKKLWRLVSEVVRKRDFKMYSRCVSCGKPFPEWNSGQAGHYRAWSICNGFFKYNIKNIASQCAGCNICSDGIVGGKFTDEMKRRHGDDFPEWVMQENLKHSGEKLELPLIVEMAEQLLEERKKYEV